ncbi:MAG: hypothetical protein HY532_06640 [Chloroflexi bacterium]|nr:hypothetical protein [Chloroflexota bacterium]
MAVAIITSLLFPLALIAGVIALVATLARRREGARQESRAVSLRRLFTYGLTLVSLAAGAVGIALLVQALLSALFTETIITRRNDILALGLALTVVGTPIWLLFWTALERTVQREPLEVQSLGRRLYFFLVMAASALASAVTAIQVLRWLIRGTDFSSANTATLLVAAGVWTFHWLMERREGPFAGEANTVRRLYGYGISLFSLALLVGGVNDILHVTLSGAYATLFGAPDLLVEDFTLWNDATKGALATAVVGGALWWRHWLWLAGDVASTIRQVYLYLFAILGGAIIVVTALSIGLYYVLQWFMGNPAAAEARVHFGVFPGLVAAAGVGSGLWVYHWTVLREEAAMAGGGLGATQRLYGYLVATVGLVVLATGLTVLFSTLFGLLSARPGIIDFSWRNPFVLALTLLAVGVPVWGGYWRDVQRRVLRYGLEERTALSRRVFLYIIFGLTVLLALVNLSLVLYRVFDALLGGGTTNVLWEIRWSLGILLATGAGTAYYWSVLQEDRKAVAGQVAPEAPPAELPQRLAPLTVIAVLAGNADVSLLRPLAEALGAEVHVWRQAMGPQGAQAYTPADVTALAQQLQASPAEEIMLLVDSSGIHIMEPRPPQSG